MENIGEMGELFQQFMDLIEKQFGDSCEVILHDYSKGPMHSIADIRNGHVTGRSVGGSNTNIGFEIMKGTAEAKDEFNYLTYSSNGKVLRSSSIYFKNSAGRPIGSICVNLDITESLKLEKFLKGYNQTAEELDSKEGHKEFFTGNVHELLDKLIERTVKDFGYAPQFLSKEEKIAFIAELDAKDAFIITNSSKRVCSLLDISKYTFYKYLDAARSQGDTKKLTEN